MFSVIWCIFNIWLWFLPGTDFETELTALPTSKNAKFSHSTLMSIIGLVENFFWRRKHIPCLHQKELIQILKHFCASPGLSSASTHRGVPLSLPFTCAMSRLPAFQLLGFLPASLYSLCPLFIQTAVALIQLQTVMSASLTCCRIKNFVMTRILLLSESMGDRTLKIMISSPKYPPIA